MVVRPADVGIEANRLSELGDRLVVMAAHPLQGDPQAVVAPGVRGIQANGLFKLRDAGIPEVQAEIRLQVKDASSARPVHDRTSPSALLAKPCPAAARAPRGKNQPNGLTPCKQRIAPCSIDPEVVGVPPRTHPRNGRRRCRRGTAVPDGEKVGQGCSPYRRRFASALASSGPTAASRTRSRQGSGSACRATVSTQPRVRWPADRPVVQRGHQALPDARPEPGGNRSRHSSSAPDPPERMPPRSRGPIAQSNMSHYWTDRCKRISSSRVTNSRLSNAVEGGRPAQAEHIPQADPWPVPAPAADA